MPSVKVEIAPNLIEWVIKHTQEYIINDSMQKNLIDWRNGNKKPTFNQIESLSKATNIPLGYFFLKEPPVEKLDILEYRTIDSLKLQNPSRNLIDTINNMENIQEWMRSYLKKQDYSILDFVGSQKYTKTVLKIAQKIRQDLKIKEDWYIESEDAWDSFKKLRNKFEMCGILVMMNGIVGQNTHRKLDIEEFRAFTLIDEYAPLIFINSNDSQNGKLFSLLHEATHIWLGVNNFYNDRYSTANEISGIEKMCNAVAAEILVPNAVLISEWAAMKTEEVYDKIDLLTRRFKCGRIVIARRALENHYINYEFYNTVVEEAIKYYNDLQSMKESSGGDYYNTVASRIDNRFLLALESSINEGKTLFTDAYRLTNTNRKTFSKLIDKVRGVQL